MLAWGNAPGIQAQKALSAESAIQWFVIGPEYRGFFWQRGFAAFSVSPSQLDASLAYVDNQEEHHRVQSFQELYRDFLKKHGVEFDERYVWD